MPQTSSKSQFSLNLIVSSINLQDSSARAVEVSFVKFQQLSHQQQQQQQQQRNFANVI